MTRRIGPIELAIRNAAQKYIKRHGYGSQTKLAKTLKRTHAWVGFFLEGKRRLTIDDAKAISDALELDLPLLLRQQKRKTRSLDAVKYDRREALVQQLFLRLETDESRQAVLLTLKTLVSAEQKAYERGREAKRQPQREAADNHDPDWRERREA